MEIAVVALGLTTVLSDVGYGTSSDAEWLALVHALTVTKSLGLPEFILLGNAADVIAKANGIVNCRGKDAQHVERFRELAMSAYAPRVRYIKRSQNLAGIALAKLHPR
jgi:ribonuclease HI